MRTAPNLLQTDSSAAGRDQLDAWVDSALADSQSHAVAGQAQREQAAQELAVFGHSFVDCPSLGSLHIVETAREHQFVEDEIPLDFVQVLDQRPVLAGTEIRDDVLDFLVLAHRLEGGVLAMPHVQKQGGAVLDAADSADLPLVRRL